MADVDKVLYGFIAGEISEDFYGRTDIGKYDFGLKLCRNFFVDFCGGIKSRAGFAFGAPSQAVRGAVRTFRFRATQDDYILEFSPSKMRVLRYGAYILEAEKTIVLVEDDNLLNVPAHGYGVGDLVYCAGPGALTARYLEVYDVSTDTFRLREVGLAGGVGVSDSAGEGAAVARVYTLTTPYTSGQLSTLRIEQSYERFIITHQAHPPKLLQYIADTNWTLNDQVFGSGVPAPSAPLLTPSAAGTAGIAYVATALKNGEESVGSPYGFTKVSVDFSATAGSLRLNWNPVPGATEYNVYRSLILPAASISHAQAVGYLGRSLGPQFVDTNITPDFTKAPPINYDPFAAGAIQEILVQNPGKDYENTSIVTVSGGGGSGFIGYPIKTPDGQDLGSLVTAGVFDGMSSPPSPSSTDKDGLLSITIVNGGKGYSAPSVSVSDGTGAEFTVVLGPSTGTYPALCRLFQQRMLYAATQNEPMRRGASKPGTLGNMDLSQVVNAGDGYSYQLDSQEVRPIQHMISLRYGLLLFTSENITLLRAEEGKAISGVNALAEPQAYKGANSAEPVAIELDVVFAQRGSSSVNAMLYTEYTNSFQMQDLAVLSKHLLGSDLEILRFAWQSEPYKILWCLRSDGVLLALTYEREQEVFAWSQHVTQGRFVDLLVVREGIEEKLYVVVERFLRGRWVLCHERLEPRRISRAENYFGLDCGLSRKTTVGDRRIDVTVIDEETYELSFTGGRPASLDEGFVLFFGDGRFEVTELLDADRLTVSVVRAPKNLMHVTDRIYYVDAGTWEFIEKTSEVSGLWHLEGETVMVNADGDALGPFVVTDGSIPLPQPVARVSVGLQYICEAETLTPALAQQSIEGRVKDIISAKVRLNRTRGLQVGHDNVNYFEMKDRSEEDWGEELALRSDFPQITFGAPWDEITGIYFRQEYPLPAHILSLVAQIDVGDV